MTLTATKYQTAIILGVSEDTVENLINQGLLRRLPGNRFVHITLESLAKYTSLPIDYVLSELRLVPLKNLRVRGSNADRRIVVESETVAVA
jgi:hypothetical protein